MSGRLTEGFRDVIEMRWTEFVTFERNPDTTNFDSIIVALVRACVKGNLRAIQTSLDRLDGKIAMELEVEMPKFYTRYPKATKVADDPSIIENTPLIEAPTDLRETDTIVTGSPADIDELHTEEEEAPTGSLRTVLERMLESPRSIVDSIIEASEAVDRHDLSIGDPKVKSVIVAGLMRLVHSGRINAVFEVFDQIDGKVADKIKVLGSDVYLTRFDVIAPVGAYLNEEGVYEIAEDNITNSWALRLEQERR